MLEKGVTLLREGCYSCFDVQALIFFDEFAGWVYRLKSFDNGENPLTLAGIVAIERERNQALRCSRSIR